MTEQFDILTILNTHYPFSFDKVEFMRDGGSVSYTAYTGERKYFLRVTKPALYEIASRSLDVHIFLQNQNFSVPTVIYTDDGFPYVQVSHSDGEHLIILYNFIEGTEVNLEEDAGAVGALIGKFHSIMKGYPGALLKRDKQYYVDTYLKQMRQKQYGRVDEFAEYGCAVWERVKELPRGYCHGDLYSGNIHKTTDGRLYVLDFDTSCEGFPMYDPALICDTTDFFKLKDGDAIVCKHIYERFLPEYLQYSHLTKQEINAFYDMIALYHFALQAAILDIFGLDCVDNAFLDRQLDWLYEWRAQCAQSEPILELKTADLVLKTVTTGDVAEVARMWRYPEGRISLTDALKAIHGMRSNHHQNRQEHIDHLCLAVFEQDSDTIIGWCGLDGKSAAGLSIFYSIDADYRNRGYATQCAERLLSYAFHEVNVPFINGGCDKDNIASYQVLKKIGMRQTGVTDNGDPVFCIDRERYCGSPNAR